MKMHLSGGTPIIQLISLKVLPELLYAAIEAEMLPISFVFNIVQVGLSIAV
jgi:hypothetical protein